MLDLVSCPICDYDVHARGITTMQKTHRYHFICRRCRYAFALVTVPGNAGEPGQPSEPSKPGEPSGPDDVILIDAHNKQGVRVTPVVPTGRGSSASDAPLYAPCPGCGARGRTVHTGEHPWAGKWRVHVCNSCYVEYPPGRATAGRGPLRYNSYTDPVTGSVRITRHQLPAHNPPD